MTVFRAPATSANIGAGFDTAAVAFDLWNELEVTDGAGVVVEGEGASGASRRRLQPRRARVRAARRPGRKALPLHQPDPARARARLVGGRDRARPRGGGTGRERRGAARRRDHARAARRQPRGRAPRRPHPLVGRADRADRRAAAARRGRRRPAGSEPRPRAPARRCPRPCPTTRRPRARAARRCSAPARRAAMRRSSRPRSATGSTSRTARPRRSPRSEPTPPAGCGGATLSGSGPTVIAWASDGAACAAELRARFPDHEILELDIAPRGAL